MSLIDLHVCHADFSTTILVAETCREELYGPLRPCERNDGPVYQISAYDAREGRTKPEAVTFHAGPWELHRAWLHATGGIELDVSGMAGV